MMISDTAKLQTERAEFELEEAERLKKELLGVVDGEVYGVDRGKGQGCWERKVM